MRTVDTFGRLGFLATLRRWAFIAVFRMKTVIHVSLELACAMKPRSRANEAVSSEPFRTIIAGGSTVIRSGVIVTIRTIRGHSNFDSDLSFRFGGISGDADYRNAR